MTISNKKHGLALKYVSNLSQYSPADGSKLQLKQLKGDLNMGVEKGFEIEKTEKDNLNIRKAKSYQILNRDGCSRKIRLKYLKGINKSKGSETTDESTEKDLLETLDDSVEPQTSEPLY
ncbi:MAG: hypothetical protein P4L69_13075 [Desulfosporosinus sp.]|nr:hypothetical protein [Desulfosporosinus sp.]